MKRFVILFFAAALYVGCVSGTAQPRPLKSGVSPAKVDTARIAYDLERKRNIGVRLAAKAALKPNRELLPNMRVPKTRKAEFVRTKGGEP